MTNIRDWCISRQLWWGHRIPVYYAPDGTFTAARNEQEARKKLGFESSVPLRQDDDVLDTWFSSWLWPFSTMGWPEDTPDLRYFHPTDTLVTGPDIIFFWVARMVMASMEFMKGEPGREGRPRQKETELIPFRHVYFTSIIRDSQGRKMSKSLGNSPDPLDVINEYGADALRFTMAFLSPLGQDVLFSSDKCETGRNFANKIWNAGRFLLMNRNELCSKDPDLNALPLEHQDLADRWILSRLNSTIAAVDKLLTEFQVNETSKVLYEFIWHDFCDWYVELVKTRFYGDESSAVKEVVIRRALWVFDRALRLLHPLMPFVTEELWQHLTERKGESLMRSDYPASDASLIDAPTERAMAFVQNIISAVRNIRGENNIPPSKEIPLQLIVPSKDQRTILGSYEGYIRKLCKVTGITNITAAQKPKLSSSAVVDGVELFVPLEGIIDPDVERKRLEKEITRIQGMLDGIGKKLKNPQFTGRAPKEVVDKEREKEKTFRDNMEKLKENLKQLGK